MVECRRCGRELKRQQPPDVAEQSGIHRFASRQRESLTPPPALARRRQPCCRRGRQGVRGGGARSAWHGCAHAMRAARFDSAAILLPASIPRRAAASAFPRRGASAAGWQQRRRAAMQQRARCMSPTVHAAWRRRQVARHASRQQRRQPAGSRQLPPPPPSSRYQRSAAKVAPSAARSLSCPLLARLLARFTASRRRQRCRL